MTETSADRRRFLSICTSGLLVVIGGAVVVPAAAYVASPLRKHGGDGVVDFSDAGPLEAIPAGEWKLVSLEIVRQNGWVRSRESRSVWVRRDGPGQQDVQVLSPICPHLGCPVAWQLAQQEFRCPCHGGTFSAAGKLIGGPPPRGMDTLPFEVREGHLWVQWIDFQAGVPERVAVQI